MTNPLPASVTGSGIQPPRVMPAGTAPASLPVMVRLTLLRFIVATRKREWIPGVVLLVPLMVIGVAAMASPAPDDQRAGILFLVISVAYFAYVGWSARRQLRDGFSVGADHTGVYLRPNLDRTRVVFVPWSGVEAVYVRSWRGTQLVVKPHDRVIEHSFELERKGRWEDRLYAEIAQSRRIKKLRTNIHAPIPGVDRVELLNNLRYQAAGRAPVEMP